MAIGIEQAFVNAVSSVLSKISSGLIDMIRFFIDDVLIKLITQNPVPRSDADMPSLNEPYADSSTCSSVPAYSGDSFAIKQCEMWSELYHNVYLSEVVSSAVVILVISFTIVMLSKIASEAGSSNDIVDSGYDVKERMIKVVLGLVLWWPAATTLLMFVDLVTRTLSGASSGGYMAGSLSGAGSSIGAVTGGLLLFGLGSTVLLAVVAFWVLRYILLVVLMVAMPVILSLWTLEIGPLKKVATASKSFFDFFIILALAPIPAGIVLLLGNSATAVTTSLLESLSLGEFGFMIRGIIFISFPIVAGLVPVLMFKDQATNTLAGNVVGDKVENLFTDKIGGAAGVGDDYDSYADQIKSRNKDVADDKLGGEYDSVEERVASNARGDYDSVKGRVSAGAKSNAQSAVRGAQDIGARGVKGAAVGGAGLVWHRDAVADGIRERASEKKEHIQERDFKQEMVNGVKERASSAGETARQGAASAKDAALTPVDKTNQAYTGAMAQASTIRDTNEDDVRDVFGTTEAIENEMGDSISAFDAMFNRGTNAATGEAEGGVNHGDQIAFDTLDGMGSTTTSQGDKEATAGDSVDRAMGMDATQSHSNADAIYSSFDASFREDQKEDIEESVDRIQSAGEGEIETEDVESVQETVSEATGEDISKADVYSLLSEEEEDNKDYTKSKRIMAAIAGTDADEVEDPVLQRSIEEYKESEIGEYGEELTELDEDSIQKMFGVTDTAKINTGELISNIRSKETEEAYKTLLDSLSTVDVDEYEEMEEGELEELVESELGGEYTASIEKLQQQADWEGNNIFDEFGIGKNQIESEMFDKFDVQDIEDGDKFEEAIEYFQRGQVEKAEEALIDAMHTVEKDGEKLVAGKNQEEIDELVEELADPIDGAVLESLEDPNFTESLSGDEQIKEEFEDTLQNIADSQHTEVAQRTLKMMSEIDSNNVSDPDLKSAATRFESLEEIEDELDVDDVEVDMEDVQEELASMSDEERASVARAMGHGEDNEMHTALNRLAVSESLGTARFEDKEAEGDGVPQEGYESERGDEYEDTDVEEYDGDVPSDSVDMAELFDDEDE
jgi:tetratricopeptide (TPR) repeat protein